MIIANRDHPHAMNRFDRQIRLRDGRRLGYAEYGDALGRPVFHFHGFPSSRLEAGLHHRLVEERNIHLIAVDRPGCGLSDYQTGRRMLDWPDDVAELADALGIGRFGVLGVSGGGPYALACAWKIPERLDAVTLACCLGPVHDPALRKVMGWHARLAFLLARHSPRLLWPVYSGTLAIGVRLWPGTTYIWKMASTPGADRATLRDAEVKACLMASVRESVRHGSAGVSREALLYTNDWGFDLTEIALPVDLWHGTADRIVPPAHTQFIAQALAQPRVHLLEGEGHFSLPIRHMGAMLG